MPEKRDDNGAFSRRFKHVELEELSDAEGYECKSNVADKTHIAYKCLRYRTEE